MQTEKRQGCGRRPLEQTAARQDTFRGRLGARIRATRVARGLTIQQAAARTGGFVLSSSWASWESGAVTPGIDKFLAVCAALAVSIRDLLPEGMDRPDHTTLDALRAD